MLLVIPLFWQRELNYISKIVIVLWRYRVPERVLTSFPGHNGTWSLYHNLPDLGWLGLADGPWGRGSSFVAGQIIGGFGLGIPLPGIQNPSTHAASGSPQPHVGYIVT